LVAKVKSKADYDCFLSGYKMEPDEPVLKVIPGAKAIREKLPEIAEEQPLLFDELPKFKTARSAQLFVSLALMNPINAEILNRLHYLNLDDIWLTSGCLFQSVWNVLSGQPATDGIRDYDIFYHDGDESWEAEDKVIKQCETLFSDLHCNIEVRNQSRVHLWYEEKFDIEYKPLKSAPHAVRRFPSRASAVALTKLKNGRIYYYAPFGFRELLGMEIKPNYRLPIGSVYNAKTSRWLSHWERLDVHPWDNSL